MAILKFGPNQRKGTGHEKLAEMTIFGPFWPYWWHKTSGTIRTQCV